MGKQRCEGCRWFHRFNSQLIGECRRYPPQHAHTQHGWLAVEQSDSCGEWTDASITPEQHERRELVRQFALAIVEGVYANPDDVDVHVMLQAKRYADRFIEAIKDGQS